MEGDDAKQVLPLTLLCAQAPDPFFQIWGKLPAIQSACESGVSSRLGRSKQRFYPVASAVTAHLSKIAQIWKFPTMAQNYKPPKTTTGRRFEQVQPKWAV